jgi:hypothetical protein
MLDFLNNFTIFDLAAYSDTLQIQTKKKKSDVDKIITKKITEELERIPTFGDIKANSDGDNYSISAKRTRWYYALRVVINYQVKSNNASTLVNIQNKHYLMQPLYWLIVIGFCAVVGIAGTGILFALMFVLFFLVEVFLATQNFKKIFHRVKTNLEHELA